MHPNAFLRTYWRLEVRPQIFVAMSFAPEYTRRYEDVIAAAIGAIKVDGVPLSPYRVDSSKSGDSILTDIIDGIAHARMVVADLSSIGKDSKSGEAYRNGNVMYEVGLALACRQPADVLLLRDDNDKFLFDVSTVPHMRLNFVEVDAARAALHAELLTRLREQEFVSDARVQLAMASLSNQEVALLAGFRSLSEGQASGWEFGGTILSVYEAAIMRLLDKRLIKLEARFQEGHPAYSLTALGRVVAESVETSIPRVAPATAVPAPKA